MVLITFFNGVIWFVYKLCFQNVISVSGERPFDMEDSLLLGENYQHSFGMDSGEFPPETASYHYDDFHTIDWQRDIARDRMRHRYIVKKKKNSFFEMFKSTHDAWSGWLCVSLVGVAAGCVAGNSSNPILIQSMSGARQHVNIISIQSNFNVNSMPTQHHDN